MSKAPEKVLAVCNAWIENRQALVEKLIRALWCAGRVAVLFSQSLPSIMAPVIDLAFPIVLGGLILREIIAGKNWRKPWRCLVR